MDRDMLMLQRQQQQEQQQGEQQQHHIPKHSQRQQGQQKGRAEGSSDLSGGAWIPHLADSGSTAVLAMLLYPPWRCGAVDRARSTHRTGQGCPPQQPPASDGAVDYKQPNCSPQQQPPEPKGTPLLGQDRQAPALGSGSRDKPCDSKRAKSRGAEARPPRWAPAWGSGSPPLLLVANVGNSKALLCRGGTGSSSGSADRPGRACHTPAAAAAAAAAAASTKATEAQPRQLHAVLLTRDHEPWQADERERILRAGGIISAASGAGSATYARAQLRMLSYRCVFSHLLYPVVF